MKPTTFVIVWVMCWPLAGCRSGAAKRSAAVAVGMVSASGPGGERVQPSAEEELSEQLAGLEKSGRAPLTLGKKAVDTVNAWLSDPTLKKLGPHISAPSCFSGGCAIVINHRDEIIYSRVRDTISRNRAFRDWQGPKFLSGPIPAPDGTINGTWILFSDAADEGRGPS